MFAPEGKGEGRVSVDTLSLMDEFRSFHGDEDCGWAQHWRKSLGGNNVLGFGYLTARHQWNHVVSSKIG